MSETVTLTIDGREVTVPKGMTILDAAAQLGIEIPVICYHPHLTANGLCRICSVDAGGRVQAAACVSQCADGMKIETNSEDVRRGAAGEYRDAGPGLAEQRPDQQRDD